MLCLIICGEPDYMEHALFLDAGRKYFPPDKVKKLTDRMSFLGFDTLVYHFSEDMGMRLESRKYPWLAGSDSSLITQKYTVNDPDEGKYVTQDEMRGIAEYALKKGISVMPSFDSPGHMNYIVKRYYEYTGHDIGNYYHAGDKVSIVQGSGLPQANAHSRGIDISNPEAVGFVHELIEEYAELFRSFGATAFDIGGDELLGWGETPEKGTVKWKQLEHWQKYAAEKTGDEHAAAYDAFLLYMNDLNAMLRGMGYKSVRMWNDDADRAHDTGWTGTVKLDRSIDIEYWTDNTPNSVHTFAGEGHKIYNYINTYGYYVLTKSARAGENYPKVNPESIRNEWNPSAFSDKDVSRNLRDVAGCALCVWCDDPTLRTCDELIEELYPIMTAYSEKMSI